MNEDPGIATDEHRRLVQRILAGGIPEGKDFDACRAILNGEADDEVAIGALFMLLQGALADPFFGIDDTQRVVPILKGLARGKLSVRDLL
jgi:hypothetical protein